MADCSRGLRAVLTNGWVVLLLVILIKLHGINTEIYECPDEWVEYNVKCYRFVFFPELDHDSARVHCGKDGASLLGINSEDEHAFVSEWLMDNDLSRREFYTSGLIRNLAEGDLIWESDGSHVPPNLHFWLSDSDKNDVGQFITYKYGVTTYGWSRAPTNTLLPFICEISREEAYRITDEKRDFDYGTNISDPNEVPRGPKFTKQPRDVMLVAGIKSVVIDCASFANPVPQYRMYKTHTGTGESTLITPHLDSRYALTNGMLTISQPTENQDEGLYHCEASNQFGTVVSESGTISFGYLGEFSNVQRDKVRVRKHHFGVIDCIPPNYKPAIAFGWMKNDPGNFIRTDLMLHLFPSYNGKLYFSEVGSSDAAVYYCMVKLMPNRGTDLGTQQPPAAVSLPIELEVTDNMPKVWGPEIGNDFIAVFPTTPLRGQQIRMECLAFGTMPIVYEWWREDLPMPLGAEFLEENRVLVIDGALLENSGVYWCRASRGIAGQGGAFDEKSVSLTINAKPYFIYELHDQHVDEGRRLTWRCEARGQPAPTYTWLKDGEPLITDPGNVEISKNVLTIVSPEASKHNGMYQCRAHNTHGTSYSTGQLRVLGFKPTFAKSPVQSESVGAVGGTVSIVCSPEAAPRPTITWLKNGGAVGSTDNDARIQVLGNGNLVISRLVTSDEGTYTCRAENSYGTASDFTALEVLDRTTISNRPVNTAVIVNNTAFLACQTSHDPALDVVTSWFFQGKPLNWRDKHYLRGTAGGIGGLYIQGAQKRHSGSYSCRAKTTFDTVVANATLTVRGPPGEPAGLNVQYDEDHDPDTITLQWNVGASWGAVITHYTVQFNTNFNDTWRVIKDDIPASSTVVPIRDKRETEISKLNPWTGYRFRVAARNRYGMGPYSLPTGLYHTPKAPPRRALENITSGGGKVGDLNITWVPLQPEEKGGPGFGYNVYFRRNDAISADYTRVAVGDVTSYVTLIKYDLFYTKFDVIVQAYNDAGRGPNSSVTTIYSAEDLPIGTPRNVMIFRKNSTALNITWIPVPNTREFMRGRALGYRINYWETEDSNPLTRSAFTGKPTNHFTVIGLEAETWYDMDVQVYNGAGLGPRSEPYRQRTWKSAINWQPTEVAVWSHGPDSVYVTWRGSKPQPHEESLWGYIIQYWPATDNIRLADDKYCGRVNYCVIYGLRKSTIYKLRVDPYSRAGDGASSPDLLFTLGGQIHYDPRTTEILGNANRPTFSLLLLILLNFIVFL